MPQIERIISRGQLLALTFMQDAVAASQSNVQLPIAEVNAGAANAIDGYVMPGPSCETYLFGASADGDVEDYMELDGSLKSVKDHDAALTDAGYEVVR